MKEKVVLITGSATGIGEITAQKFAENNYQVLFHGIDDNVFDVAHKYAKKYGKNFLAFKTDLTKQDHVDAMFQKIFSEVASVDILVNNAGMQYVSPIEEFSLNKWNDILAINLTTPFYLSQKVWPLMKKNRFGRIINISSVHGIRASEFKSAYVSSKHGLNGLTKVLALEGAPFGITVNAICPGYVKTAMVEGQIQDQAKAHNLSVEKVVSEVILKKQAIKDFLNPTTIADMVYFLSQESSNTITGSEIVMDGGWSIQ